MSKMQDYEELVSFLGTWGRFQRRVMLLLCLISIPSGYVVLSVFFLLASPTHHCHIPDHRNMSQDWIQASIPKQDVAGQPERSSCSRYELDLVQNLSTLGSSPEDVLSGLNQEDCKDGWTYNTEYYLSTVVTEGLVLMCPMLLHRSSMSIIFQFNLVCSDQWKMPLTSLVYFLGGLCGCFISGQISDRCGRKPVVFGAIAILSVCSSVMAFAPSWPVFTVLFFIMGMGQMACYIILFVMGSEILVGSARCLYCTLCLPSVWVVGAMLLPATAYLVRNWRHLSLIMAVPGVACFPLWWQISESPRWLVSRGRLMEAELLLRSAALENQVEPPHILFQSANIEKATNNKSLGFLDLLRTTNIRYITLILWLIWFSLGLSFSGLSFNMSGLYGSPFLNYSLIMLVEIPACVVSWVMACSYSRRLSFIGFTLLGALALLLIQITLTSQPVLTLALVLLGKFGILVGYTVLYVHTGELSPTVIRNTAMSSCATFSRVGSSISPYLMQLAVFNEFLPWIAAGSLSLISVLLYILLPETFRQPLPDTIQEMGHIQRFRWPRAFTSSPKDDEIRAIDLTTKPEMISTIHI